MNRFAAPPAECQLVLTWGDVYRSCARHFVECSTADWKRVKVMCGEMIGRDAAFSEACA